MRHERALGTKMRVVPARNGWSWLVRGFALFRKNPPMWLFLVFTYSLAVTLLGQIRYLGPAASTRAAAGVFGELHGHVRGARARRHAAARPAHLGLPERHARR